MPFGIEEIALLRICLFSHFCDGKLIETVIGCGENGKLENLVWWLL